jgi:hypothetical protein
MILVKLALIGFITTILRAIMQLLIPAGEQTILAPSVFVNNGSMPVAFMVYGTIAYTTIAAIFLILYQNMSGNRIIKGLKFGISFSLLWSIYLVEPLAHAATIDKIIYPIVDSAALIVMGLLLGRFISTASSNEKYKFTKNSLLNLSLITSLFFIGRMMEYTIFNIYSTFNNSTLASIIWVIGTGAVIGLIFDYLNASIKSKSILGKSFIFGIVVFGVNLFAFNFFMPIVFKSDILDLFIRTIMDIIFVFIGSYFANRIKYRDNVLQ